MIQVNDLSFHYAGSKKRVFDHFNLQLEANKVYGLLGKNGTGKSTLLYLLSGLLRPQQGKVIVDGHEAAKRHAAMLREIFIMPEEFTLPEVSVAHYAKLIAPFYPRFSNDILRHCLEEFELDTTVNLGRLSMGQKKKAFMSVALAANTRYMFMDEPTNGLDIPSKSQFRKVVASQMSDDRTLLLSTHQVHDVESLIDHILFLDADRLVLDQPVSQITDRFVFEYRQPSDMANVLYAEPTMQGNAVIALRTPDKEESPINLELFFNAVAQGKIDMNAEEETDRSSISE